MTDHTFDLQDDSLVHLTEFAEMRVFWRGIRKIVERRTFFAIYISPNAAIVVPKRAFASADVARGFIATGQAKLRPSA